MAVRLRLRRTGTRNKACYRIVAADSRSPRDGRFIEILGYYDPRHANEEINLGRAEYWISNGAQPSRTVAAVIKRAQDSPEPTVTTSSSTSSDEIEQNTGPATEVGSEMNTAQTNEGFESSPTVEADATKGETEDVSEERPASDQESSSGRSMPDVSNENTSDDQSPDESSLEKSSS